MNELATARREPGSNNNSSDAIIQLCSGFGQLHTNEPDPKRPDKKLTPYVTITPEQIRALVDKPQCVDKKLAQWVILSTLLCRTHKTQAQEGCFYALWADFDETPPTLAELAKNLATVFGGADYELYNTKSATEANQKARLIVFLEHPLSGEQWQFAQEILNDKFEALGVIPDRANEGTGQLCYLPNRGEFYDSINQRTGNLFDPPTQWLKEITAKREKIKADTDALEQKKQLAIESRASLKLSATSGAEALRTAFNQAYTVEELLLEAGYAKRGLSFRHPNSESGSYSASISLETGRVNALSERDPLWTAGEGAHDAFSVFTVLKHDGVSSKACIDAGDNYLTIGGKSWNQVVRREYKQEPAKPQYGTDNINFDDETLAHDFPTFESGFYGLAGEVAKLATEESEADPVAVYFSFLVAAAALLGRNKYYQVGDSQHNARLFVTLVGASSRARKGTSFKPVERIIRKAEEVYRKIASLKEHLVIHNGGLSSAEGLIYAVRDESEEIQKNGKPCWEAVTDKRMLVVEEEFAGVLKVAQREGNTLSPVLRKAWDGGTLAPMTKNNRVRATDPHINALCHITQYELKSVMSRNDVYNGFANRFLWSCVRRTRKLAYPQPMDKDGVLNIAIKLSEAMKAADGTEFFEVALCDEARKFWDVEYFTVSTDKPGELGAVTSRNEAHVLRLALLFCLLDAKSIIEVVHLKAAIDVVNYSTQSAKFIFTVPTADAPDAQKLLAALDSKQMTQTEINDLFGGHKSTKELGELLTDLQALNKIRKQKTPKSKKVTWEKI